MPVLYRVPNPEEQLGRTGAIGMRTRIRTEASATVPVVKDRFRKGARAGPAGPGTRRRRRAAEARWSAMLEREGSVHEGLETKEFA